MGVRREGRYGGRDKGEYRESIGKLGRGRVALREEGGRLRGREGRYQGEKEA